MGATQQQDKGDKSQTVPQGTEQQQSKKGAASNSVQLDPKTPIPIDYGSNIFITTKGKQYVPFLNPKDVFGQLLTEAMLLSPTTHSCVTSKAQYCLGKGWYIKNGKEDKNLTTWAAMLNRKQQSLNDIMLKMNNALFTAGNTYVEIVRGQIGGTKFIRLYPRSYLDCRLSLPDDDDICNTVFYSKYFRQKNFWNLKFTEITEIPIWSPNMFDNPWVKGLDGFEHTMLHLKIDTEANEYYGFPSNIACLPQQILEYKAARYNLDNFDNNLVIGGVIAVKGAMTDEEALALGKNIIYQHSGDGKRGRYVIINSANGIPEGVDIKDFTKQVEGSFIESDTHNSEKIYTENKWNKVLIGGSENKNIGSGNSAYLRSVFDIASSTVIEPHQLFMIDKFIRPLMLIRDEFMKDGSSKYDIGIKAIQPLSFLGDIDVNAILTKDEGREIIGKDPIGGDKGSEFIKTAKDTTNNQNPTGTNVPD